MNQIMKLDRLPYLAAVIEAGSFTQAADRLGVTKAVVSAQVSRLEEELGVALLNRTTRKVSPTPEGDLLYERSRIILQEAADVREALSSAMDRPTGVLRVTAPLDYGELVLVPLMAEFRKLYPECRVTLDLTDQIVDMQSGKWDLSVRLGWLNDSSMKARKVSEFRQALVARPELLTGEGSPTVISDLASLPFVGNTALSDPGTWDFTGQNGQVERVRFDVVASMSTTPAVLEAVKCGLGASVLPCFLVDDAIQKGDLVQLLPEWELRKGGIYMVFPPARYRPPKVKVFADMLIEAVGRR